MNKCQLYVDESCKGNHQYLVNGGLIIEHDNIMDCLGDLFQLKRLKGCADEIKWEKTNKYRIDAYYKVVDKFFEFIEKDVIHFHCLVINQHKLDHKHFNQGMPSIGFSKFIYQLLVSKFGRLYGHYDGIYVFLDEKTTATPLEEFRNILNNGIARRFEHAHKPFKKVRFCESKKSLFLQFNDLILGAVATRINSHHLKIENYRKEKRDLSEYVIKKSGIKDIMVDSPANKQFSIWHLNMGK